MAETPQVEETGVQLDMETGRELASEAPAIEKYSAGLSFFTEREMYFTVALLL